MTKLKIQSIKIVNEIAQSKLVKHKEPVTIKNGGKVYSTGKRKNAIARVWVQKGNGKIVINKKNIEQYFTRETHIKTLLQPFVVTKTSGQYDVICTVKGGGVSGQMGAVLHGIAKVLNKSVPELHNILHQAGLLTRDSRVVERKKYGKHKARKSTQFSKR